MNNARQLLSDFAAPNFEMRMDAFWTIGMVGYAEAAIECRDPQHAEPLFDRLAPWGDQLSCGGTITAGPISHYLGGLATVLGRYDEADKYFSHASDMSERMHAKFFAARTSLSSGKMLAERNLPGDTQRARDLTHQSPERGGQERVRNRRAPFHRGTSTTRLTAGRSVQPANILRTNHPGRADAHSDSQPDEERTSQVSHPDRNRPGRDDTYLHGLTIRRSKVRSLPAPPIHQGKVADARVPAVRSPSFCKRPANGPPDGRPGAPSGLPPEMARRSGEVSVLPPSQGAAVGQM